MPWVTLQLLGSEHTLAMTMAEGICLTRACRAITWAPADVMLLRERSTAVTVAFWLRASVKLSILLSWMSQLPSDTHNSLASCDFSCSITVSNLRIALAVSSALLIHQSPMSYFGQE